MNEVSMEKIWREKSCRYSIRKLTVGIASVLLGAIFLASHTSSADTIEVKQNDPTLEKTTAKTDTVTKTTESTEHIQPNEPIDHTKPVLADNSSSEGKPVKADITSATTNQASIEAIVKPNKNKETKKQELPVTKQSNYKLNYDRSTALIKFHLVQTLSNRQIILLKNNFQLLVKHPIHYYSCLD